MNQGEQSILLLGAKHNTTDRRKSSNKNLKTESTVANIGILRTKRKLRLLLASKKDLN